MEKMNWYSALIPSRALIWWRYFPLDPSCKFWDVEDVQELHVDGFAKPIVSSETDGAKSFDLVIYPTICF